MNVTCPACGADMSLDVLLAHEDSRQALAQLCLLTVPLAAQVMRYVALFRPGKRQMSHSRVATLIGELLPDLQRGAIDRNGREWPAPQETWRAAFERLSEARDKGALTLPLKSHGYLYEVIAGLADKAEGVAERQREDERRHGVREPGSAASEPVAFEKVLATIEAPKGPSAYARKLQAEIAVRKQGGAAA